MRLRRSALNGPGWHRGRRGRGFTYTDGDGNKLDAEARQRVADLVIPPAWRDVWICPYPNGHVQAVGTDDAGRRQYLYHERWRSERDEEKHDRVLGLVPRLPAFRAEVGRMMGGSGLGADRVFGTALHLLDRGVFRVGGESYAQENGSHGVATLLCSHVEVSGDEVGFRFPAKSGIEFVRSVRDGALARVVRALRRGRSGEDRLLVYREGRKRCEVHSDEVNERFKGLVGEEYSVKDLRTWHGTVSAAVGFSGVFAEVGLPGSKAGVRRVEAEVMRRVAEELGNTPAVARKSYVDPRVVGAFEGGRVIREGISDREARDRAVARLVRRG
ncbi:DNA topoisomerase IB [Umezawaea sp. Da 62-37]|uniref:DNA topoisomerase IB n=1 Tax=Umezawaea sp. Da 62-37 TaxID=3075927 RepID=UPI0028F713EC|nr:DNA topoisomerase IB [Umezawaea sp. Da 62-37]WNV89379.1 DNA topoisomerase IB [Umezawaea sp. Da 62-37]